MFSKQQKGFTLIELMVSIAIGLFLLAGVLTVYMNSRQSQRVVDEDVRMMDDARFALETMAYDLRHAGGFGHHNHENKAKIFDEETFPDVTDQCGGAGSSWVVNLDRPVFAVNDNTDYLSLGDCMDDWAQGDTLELRYAVPLPLATLEANLIPDALYLKSIPDYAYMFRGDTPPLVTKFELNPGTPKPNIRYFLWQSRGYYISANTDPGDGVPSLRLVSVEPGPIVTNTVLLKGVEDLQVQFGLDIPDVGNSQGDESADTYEHPAAGIKWNQAIAARIWLVVRSEKEYPEVNPLKSYEIAGVAKVFNDQYKRIVVSTSVRLRNVNTGE